MTNGQQDQQPAPKEKAWKMPNLSKWIGPVVVLGIVGYGVLAFVNKWWPFDGSIMLPSLGGVTNGPAQMTSDMMTSTTGTDVSMIQRQVQSNIGSGNVNPAMIQAQIKQQIAAARARAASEEAAIRAKFPNFPQMKMVTG